MFGKKKSSRKSRPMLRLSGADGSILLECPTSDYMLPEKVVLALSTEYFNDPEPCAIHRGAVHRRAMLELMEYCSQPEPVSIETLPPAMRSYFAEGASFVQITEQLP